MNELTVELVQRDFQQRGRRGEIALGEVNGGGAFVGIEWEAWRSGIPRIEGQRGEFLIKGGVAVRINQRQMGMLWPTVHFASPYATELVRGGPCHRNCPSTCQHTSDFPQCITAHRNGEEPASNAGSCRQHKPHGERNGFCP
jgi:hypothetical protein